MPVDEGSLLQILMISLNIHVTQSHTVLVYGMYDYKRKLACFMV